jgi:hypothetical protein
VALVVCAVDELEFEIGSRLLREVYASGNDFPVALIGDEIVCVNGLDPHAVMDALSKRSKRLH